MDLEMNVADDNIINDKHSYTLMWVPEYGHFSFYVVCLKPTKINNEITKFRMKFVGNQLVGSIKGNESGEAWRDFADFIFHNNLDGIICSYFKVDDDSRKIVENSFGGICFDQIGRFFLNNHHFRRSFCNDDDM